MSDSEHGSGKSGMLLLCGFCLPVLYVLSLGPAVWLVVANGGTGRDLVTFVYAPLKWLADHSDTTRDWLEWYVSFWV